MKNDEKDWVGTRYYMWSSVRDLPNTWLYNKDSNIYLEITPTYKWHTRDPKEDKALSRMRNMPVITGPWL